MKASILFLAASACRSLPADKLSDDIDSGEMNQNNAPTVQSVQLSPTQVFTNDTITATAVLLDADEQTLSSTYEWHVVDVSGADNVVQTGADNNLIGQHFSRDERVYVVVTADDGLEASQPLSSSTLVVLNTPPTVPALQLSPDPALAGQDDLTCAVESPSVDADGDAVVYSYIWTDNDGTVAQQSIETAATNDVLVASAVTESLWTCEVVASDLTDSAPPVSVSLSVAAPVIDVDQDGSPSELDCDDFNSVTYPGAPELCDGWDNDCDGVIPEVIETWSFDSDLSATYSSGHGFSGSYSTSAGVCNGGISNNDILSTGSGSLDQYSNGFTVAVWAKGSGSMLAKSGTGHAAPEEFQISAGSSSNFSVNWPGTSYGAAEPVFSASGACDTTGTHRFVVGTAAPNEALRLYCDGQQIDSQEFTSMVWSGQPFYIGANPAGGLETGSYSLDELKMYSCSLQPSAIAAHFSCGGCGCDASNSPCPVGEYWDGGACIQP